VTIAAGAEHPIEIVLGRVPQAPSTGTLVIDGAPFRAVLTLDGKEIGPAKDFRQELSAGAHVIAVSAKGCEPTKQKVTVVAGNTLRVPLHS
jgi:PEGA domain-containing protein